MIETKLLYKKWISHLYEAKKQQTDSDASSGVCERTPTQSPIEEPKESTLKAKWVSWWWLMVKRGLCDCHTNQQNLSSTLTLQIKSEKSINIFQYRVNIFYLNWIYLYLSLFIFTYKLLSTIYFLISKILHPICTNLA